ncbi:type 1 glutamine amidotransferase family protein [Pseudobacter ginsenosidimutans]|uniref:Putative intracellular protease/amidase n=1 Tax=Pseudobacter ginsenosidimutans TaxID=661488 RepID=A0A4Q7MTE1_9BACT|nr:type 1 glutamine amidotransferase family protein [Pseudobacter ginsenosidimutans]RZS72105.1 putative intracellular protease/amidase [Pseudobacter ginsenosidimutans]
MKKRICYLFVFNGYADWEAAYTVAHLNKYSDFMIRTFSIDGQTITSMGDIRIEPDHSLEEVDPKKVDLLLLPGGEAWENEEHQEIALLVEAFLHANKTVAAICGATVLLGNHGFLDHVPHTSNDLAYLKDLAPDYRGDAHYVQEPCVSSDNLITANGAAALELMVAIFKKFNVMEDSVTDAVYDLFRSAGMENRMFAETEA